MALSSLRNTKSPVHMLPAPPPIAWSSSALFLDVDGTLLDIAEHPDDVRADAGLISSLQTTADRLGGALALISGRRVSEINRIFDPARFPASGLHGVQYQDINGDRIDKTSVSLPEQAVSAVKELADVSPGVLLELKDFGIALHYRQAPNLEQTCRNLMSSVASTIGDDFRLIEGKMVLELTPRSVSKGVAIAEFLKSEPFAGRKPVFVGDDVTDEDGFDVANRLSGLSIRVGKSHKTKAKYALRDVAAVRVWLENTQEK